MKVDAYPAIYRVANLWLIRLQYALLLAAATIALWFDKQSTTLYIAYAAIVFGSTVLLLYMSLSKPEKTWYGCRALAESIKTSTWRYMMRAEPFDGTLSPRDAEQKLSEFLREILTVNHYARESVRRTVLSGDQADQVTKEMRAWREQPLEDRRKFYQKERLEEQRAWYQDKALSNQRHFKCWVVACILSQTCAIVIVLVRIAYNDELSIWPTDPFLILASSLIGWIQTKKFNELVSAYSLTVHEISIIQGHSKDQSSEEGFSGFVNEAERVFSREHTQWVARQDS